jgi:hypothetical protein
LGNSISSEESTEITEDVVAVAVAARVAFDEIFASFDVKVVVRCAGTAKVAVKGPPPCVRVTTGGQVTATVFAVFAFGCGGSGRCGSIGTLE